MTIPPELEDVLSIDLEIMHGRGTRVPLTVLLDNLGDGMGLDEVVEEYPSVTREQAGKVMCWEQKLTRQAIGLKVVQ